MFERKSKFKFFKDSTAKIEEADPDIDRVFPQAKTGFERERIGR